MSLSERCGRDNALSAPNATVPPAILPIFRLINGLGSG